MRVVVGKHRHAWVVGKADEVKAVSVIGKVFAKYFMNGGIEEGEAGIGKGEFMPVGSDGNVVLSFSLLNADPSDWVYDWDFEKIGERMLNPVVEALRPIAEINIESQVLYHTPKSSYSYFDDKLGGNVLSMGDIPFFVNSNEWHLDTSISATGRSKVLQFVVYIPSARECPLYLQLPDGGLSKTNAFISPMWGGVLIWNPLDCSLGSKKTHGTRRKMSSQGITIPAMTSLFYSMLGDYMSSKAKVPVTKEDMTAQFQHFRRLWGYYQKDMQSVTFRCSMESKNLKNKDAMMRNLKKELDLNKYKYILKYEDQFNYIFPSCHYQKSTPIRAFMYNTGSSGDMSVTSNRKRSIDEPFSRQLRQKSSDVDKPESSQNGMTLDIALDELSSVASVLTYGIATKCLQDPIKLRAYSRLPTIEKKVEFLHVAWRLEYDPASALASLPPPS